MTELGVLDLVVRVLSLLALLGVIFSRKLMHAALFLSLFSMVQTLRYAMLAAPDVAITEAALGVGLSSLVYLAAIKRTGGRHHG